MLSACEKPTAKFHSGQKVKVKGTPIRGVIALRLSLFVDDNYYLKVSGSKRQSYPEGGGGEYLFIPPWDKDTWHYDGPYLDRQLELDK